MINLIRSSFCFEASGHKTDTRQTARVGVAFSNQWPRHHLASSPRTGTSPRRRVPRSAHTCAPRHTKQIPPPRPATSPFSQPRRPGPKLFLHLPSSPSTDSLPRGRLAVTVVVPDRDSELAIRWFSPWQRPARTRPSRSTPPSSPPATSASNSPGQFPPHKPVHSRFNTVSPGSSNQTVSYQF